MTVAAHTSSTHDVLADRLREACEGEVHAGMSLGEMTTLRVGGPAAAVLVPAGDHDISAAGRIVTELGLPWLVVGRGSNLLVTDAGWPGLVLLMGRAHRGVDIDGMTVVAGAAEPLPALAVSVADAGLTGFAWACAVPGTLGGAVRMNAGAHGGEMSDHLVEVDVVRLRSGVRETWPAPLLSLRYRHSDLPDDAVVVSASLSLTVGDVEAVRDEIAEIRAWRRDNQPLSHPNCGSVFTNPPGDSAGRLIEAAGGKHVRVGGAAVSELHANFIVTTRDATAADVLGVIAEVQRRVQVTHGIDLVPEVQIRGPRHE